MEVPAGSRAAAPAEENLDDAKKRRALTVSALRFVLTAFSAIGVPVKRSESFNDGDMDSGVERVIVLFYWNG